MGSVPSISARLPERATVSVPASLRLLAWVALATILQLARTPGLHSWRVLWAEDGTVFLPQALERSVPHALGTTYAGYLHTGPRLLAEVTTMFPVSAAAAVFAIGSAALVSLLAAYVWVASASVFETRRARALLVALFLFAPPAFMELGATAANLHWYGLVASFFAFLHRPASPRETAAAVAVVALTTLSDPLLMLLLPVLVLRPGGLRRGRLGARVIPAAAVAGLSLQAVAVLLATAPERQSAFRAPDLVAIYAQRLAGPALAGQERFDDLWLAIGWPAAFASLTVLWALVARAATSGAAERRRHALVAAAASLVLFAVPLAIRGTTEMAPQLGELFVGGARYLFAPMVLVWVPLLLLADRRGTWSGRIATLVVIVVTASSTDVTERGVGPDWPESVASARQACASGHAIVTQRVAPLSAKWFVSLPCSALE